MILSIDALACTGCGMCERVCPADLFRVSDGVSVIVYREDCCNCLQCKYVCPVDAISFDREESEKLDMSGEWGVIKTLMGAADHPMAAETRRPAWQRAKEKGTQTPGETASAKEQVL